MSRESGRILPGEWPLDLGRCNYDTLIPKRCRDVCVMDLWPADLVVLNVKPIADENTVTYLRVKLWVSAMDEAEFKGKTC